MNDTIAIAQSTFHRFARIKALYLILTICVLDVAAMSLYKTLSLGLQGELMLDCALALTLVVGLITSMVAAFEVPRELRERTAHFILSKPTGRSAFIWGKFFGICALVLCNIAFLVAGSTVVFHLILGAVPTGFLPGAALIAGEALVLTAIALTLSIFLQDSTAAIGTFAVFVIGHTLPILIRNFPSATMVTWVLPNFYHLDVKTEVSHGLSIPLRFYGVGLLYSAAYAVALAALAAVLFNREDID